MLLLLLLPVEVSAVVSATNSNAPMQMRTFVVSMTCYYYAQTAESALHRKLRVLCTLCVCESMQMLGRSTVEVVVDTLAELVAAVSCTLTRVSHAANASRRLTD